jgi:hypothetical protein
MQVKFLIKMKAGKPVLNEHATGNGSVRRFILFIACSLMLCLCFKSYAQNGTDSLKSRLYCIYSGTEKVFLHLNKDTYISGEEVLFKAYLANGAELKPDTLCKVLYIVLKNCNNQKINGLRFNLNKGTCQGLFVLPDTLSTGYYTLDAFTNNMRNFSHDLYFTSTILVANQGDDKLDKLVTRESKNHDSYNFSVFPESGKLLAGISQRVVFLFSGYTGGPGQIAEIFSDLTGTLASAQINAAGIGEILLTPRTGEKYYARFQNREYPFNTTATTGYIIKALLKDNGVIDVKIQTNIKSENSNLLHLICYGEGVKYIDNPVYLMGDSAHASLTISETGKRIVHLCLLSSSMDLLCERLLYKPDHLQEISLNLNSSVYSTRQKVQIKVSVPPSLCRSGTITFSASVSQKLPLSGLSFINGDLCNTFLFNEFGNSCTSVIRRDSLVYDQIDQFLLSHKSLPYSWESIFQNSRPQCRLLPETAGYILEGKVVTKSNEPIPGTCVYLSAPDSFVNLKYCYADPDGRFLFRLDKFYDNKNLVLQVTNPDVPDGSRIELEDKFNDEPLRPAVFEGILPDLREYLMQLRNFSLVNKVYKPMFIKSLKDSQPGRIPINCNFYGLPDQRVYTADYAELDNFNEITKNLLPGITYSENTHRVRVFDLSSHILLKENAMLFLNNIPFPDPVFVSKLDSRLIRKIELKNNHLLFGDLDIYGIVAIETNKKDIYALDATHTSLVYPNMVNDLRVSFSGPDYSMNTTQSETLPDFRQTLYWNPRLELINGQAMLEFYTSDVKGVFTVELEGIAADGQPLSGRALIEVQ